MKKSHPPKSLPYQSGRVSKTKDRDVLGDVQHWFRETDTVIIPSTNKLDKEQGGELNQQ